MNFPFKFQVKITTPHLLVKFGFSLTFSFFQTLLISSTLPLLELSVYCFIFHHTLPTCFPSLICFSLFLSLFAMVGEEWVCGGLICSLKRHASPSNARCRSFPSSFYPSLSLCLLQWEIVMPTFNLNYCLCLGGKVMYLYTYIHMYRKQ